MQLEDVLFLTVEELPVRDLSSLSPNQGLVGVLVMVSLDHSILGVDQPAYFLLHGLYLLDGNLGSLVRRSVGRVLPRDDFSDLFV